MGVVGEKRVQPEAVEAHSGDVIQVFDDAAQGAAVDVAEVIGRIPGTAVARRKPIRENLVDDGFFCPGG